MRWLKRMIRRTPPSSEVQLSEAMLRECRPSRLTPSELRAIVVVAVELGVVDVIQDEASEQNLYWRSKVLLAALWLTERLEVNPRPDKETLWLAMMFECRHIGLPSDAMKIILYSGLMLAPTQLPLFFSQPIQPKQVQAPSCDRAQDLGQGLRRCRRLVHPMSASIVVRTT